MIANDPIDSLSLILNLCPPLPLSLSLYFSPVYMLYHLTSFSDNLYREKGNLGLWKLDPSLYASLDQRQSMVMGLENMRIRLSMFSPFLLVLSISLHFQLSTSHWPVSWRIYYASWITLNFRMHCAKWFVLNGVNYSVAINLLLNSRPLILLLVTSKNRKGKVL